MNGEIKDNSAKWPAKLRQWTLYGLKRPVKSALTGLLMSLIITALWFITLNKKNVTILTIAILSAALIIFALRIAYDFVLDKLNVKKRLLANELFILFAVLAFFGTTVCALAPVLLFECTYDRAAAQSLEAYVESGDAEELCVETENGTLYGWFLHNAQGSAPTVLYFGDCSGDSAGMVLSLLENNQRLSAFSGCNFACVDYPGYGKSEGSVSDKSLKSMGLSVYDSLIDRSDTSRVAVMGFGLGTGVANYVAGKRQPMGLILLAPYSEGSNLYNSYADIFHGPMRALVSFKMKSYKFADSVTLKPLIIASTADTAIPYESSSKLFSRYKSGCNFVTIEDTAHDELWESEEVLNEIKEYLNK